MNQFKRPGGTDMQLQRNEESESILAVKVRNFLPRPCHAAMPVVALVALRATVCVALALASCNYCRRPG